MDTNEPVLCHYAAAFVDLLGQRAQLRGCGLLPDSFEDFRPIVRATVATVKWLHSVIADFHSALIDTTSTIPVAAKHELEIKKLRTTDLKYQRFSDGLLLYVSLMGDPKPQIVNGLYGLVASCGSLSLLGLTRQTPIRGGIDVAWGMELNDAELYGCVVAKSYELESEIAKYPRVVVGEHVLNCLTLWSKLSGDEVNTQYTREMSQVCLSMLARDADGLTIVDYLGPGFKKYIAGTLDQSAYYDAYSYVKSQLDRWNRENDEKLYARYVDLERYFLRSRDTWTT